MQHLRPLAVLAKYPKIAELVLRWLCRLWAPDSVKPAPIERIAADLAAQVVSEDLPLLWSAASRTDRGKFVAPSESVFLASGQHVAQPVLDLCKIMDINVVRPPPHILQV